MVWVLCANCGREFLTAEQVVADWNRNEPLNLIGDCCHYVLHQDEITGNNLERVAQYKIFGCYRRDKQMYNCDNCRQPMLVPAEYPLDQLLQETILCEECKTLPLTNCAICDEIIPDTKEFCNSCYSLETAGDDIYGENY